MIPFLRRLSNWLRGLLGLDRREGFSSRTTVQPQSDVLGNQRLSLKSPIEKQRSSHLEQPVSSKSSAESDVSPKLRRILYEAFYRLDRGSNWIDLAPLGNALRQQETEFSPQKYGFSRLSDLLEAASDLVEFDRVNNQARLLDPADVQGLLVQAFNNIPSEDGWIHLASVAHQLNQLNAAFSVPKYGFTKFKQFVDSRPDLIELRKDDSVYPPRYYARLLASSAHRIRPTIIPKPKPKSRRPEVVWLFKYAFIPNLEDIYHRLAELTLPERWYFGAAPPDTFPYPILKSYLEYTFIRLQYEGKVAVSKSKRYSAFNTGLVDRKYEPIYALFGWDQYGREQNWYLIDFCILGEAQAGKTLASTFGPLASANYFDRPVDMFYDIDAGAPQVDWRHILQDNPDRLPLSFLQTYCPQGFKPQDFRALSLGEKKAYKQQFADALSSDPQTYRVIVDRFESALRFALLKTQLNYRTAIPYYNPRKNRLQLLLPLSLMSDDTVDCSLVVDRPLPAELYIGYTILPLSWAYSNARLIGRLEAPWLNAYMAVGSETAYDAASEDEEE